jgi:hypothetical protein
MVKLQREKVHRKNAAGGISIPKSLRDLISYFKDNLRKILKSNDSVVSLFVANNDNVLGNFVCVYICVKFV